MEFVEFARAVSTALFFDGDMLRIDENIVRHLSKGEPLQRG
jgi:hypothetical protein